MVGDPFGLSDTAFVYISVYANSAPLAMSDTVMVRQSGQVNVPVLLNDTDSDGDSLSLTMVEPGKGTADVQITDTAVFYRAATGYVGMDVLTYAISDQNGGIATGQLVVFVDGNHDPVATRESVSTGVGRAVDLTFLANDWDADGDSLRITGVGGGLTGSAEVIGDRVRYKPHTGMLGRDVLSYEVSDGLGGKATGTLVVMVLEAPPPGDLDGDFSSGPEDVLPFAAGFGTVEGG